MHADVLYGCMHFAYIYMYIYAHIYIYIVVEYMHTYRVSAQYRKKHNIFQK